METRANHLVVGSFVLASIAGLLFFVLWLGKAEIDRKFDAYNIYFSGSVSGLSVASKVRYRGVPVGTVTEILIDPDNSERVIVTIEVTEGTPVKEDAVAALEMQGITGLVDVQISGGSKSSPLLEAKAGEPLPVIASVPTKLEELFEDVPNLLARATVLLDRAMFVLSDENLIAFTQTLANVQLLTADIADSSGDLKSLSSDVSNIAASIRSTAVEVDSLIDEIAERLPGLLDDASATLVAAEGALTTVDASTETLTGEAAATLNQARDTAATLAETAEQLTLLVAENRSALKDFSGEGLYEMSRFLVEARELVASLTRISERFESDPTGFLFRDSTQGYTPQ
ncbi:MAG: MCE family protein [Proteobacteria bacterium]|nr:MCE family protein [Pseudomonadota bacterium]